MIAPIETTYAGYRFRSRTEARWAVFFDAAGIRFEYEKEGYKLPSGWYLPDFWLPEIGAWVEVKGDEPSPQEVSKVAQLCAAHDSPAFIAIGAPRAGDQLIWIPPLEDCPLEGWDSGWERAERYYFGDDPVIPGRLWLLSDEVGRMFGAGHSFAARAMSSNYELASGKYPGVLSNTKCGYEASRAARFDRR